MGSSSNGGVVAITVAVIGAIGLVLAAVFGPQIIVNVNQQGQATAVAQLQPTIQSLNNAATVIPVTVEVTREVLVTVVHEIQVVVTQIATVQPLRPAVSATPVSAVTQVEVVANKGWQDTGVSIIRGQQVTIRHISGLWFTVAADGGGHDASGAPKVWICAAPECHEPLHDFPKYALIGKIGNNTILKIGNSMSFIADVGGILYLRPNYGDVDIAALNPDGSLIVGITVR